jgi:hypothetical protein
VASRVFSDTCALYGIDLADTFLRLVEAGSFQPKWSADILEELRRNLIRNTGLQRNAWSQAHRHDGKRRSTKLA